MVTYKLMGTDATCRTASFSRIDFIQVICVLEMKLMDSYNEVFYVEKLGFLRESDMNEDSMAVLFFSLIIFG
jgi:hypothetical protein